MIVPKHKHGRKLSYYMLSIEPNTKYMGKRTIDGIEPRLAVSLFTGSQHQKIHIYWISAKIIEELRPKK